MNQQRTTAASTAMTRSSSTASLNQYMAELRLAVPMNENPSNELSYSQQSQEHDMSAMTSSELVCGNGLYARIKHLEEELKNVQADKEFVWTLWRQLQASNPDLTGAIACAIQREKEKSEHKDKKVLEILVVKDEQIDELQKNLIERKTEVLSLGDKLKSAEAELSSKHDELNYTKMNLKTSMDKEQMYEQMVRLRDDKIESLTNRIKEIETESTTIKAECDQLRQTAEILEKQLR
jgi:centlein